MVLNDDVTLSKTITFLRFPLIVAVIFIHTNLSGVVINGALLEDGAQFHIYRLVHYIIKEDLSRTAVPLFFFFSGFLFFYHSDFSFWVYGQKLKKRVRTLLIPYIFWNIVVLLFTLLSQLFLSSMTSGRSRLIADYTWLDWLNLFWSHWDEMPICYQLWFIRDLMIVIIFTPILYYAIKYGKIVTLLILGGLWLAFDTSAKAPGFSLAAFFFFTFGAWYSINKQNFTVSFRFMRWPATFVYLSLVALDTWLWYRGVTGFPYINRLGIVVGLFAVISWTAYGIKKEDLHTSALLAGSSFFVYAYHGVPLAFVVKYWVKLLYPISESMMLLSYLLIPFFIAGIGVCIYALLRKYLPATTALITGGRL